MWYVGWFQIVAKWTMVVVIQMRLVRAMLRPMQWNAAARVVTQTLAVPLLSSAKVWFSNINDRCVLRCWLFLLFLFKMFAMLTMVDVIQLPFVRVIIPQMQWSARARAAMRRKAREWVLFAAVNTLRQYQLSLPWIDGCLIGDWFWQFVLLVTGNSSLL